MGPIPMDGYNKTALHTSDVYGCLHRQGQAKLTVTTGRSFYLKSVAITNDHATSVASVVFYDEAEPAAAAAGTAANRRLNLRVGQANTANFEFKGRGVRFDTGVCAIAAAGTVPVYGVHVSGYEE